MFVTEDGVMDLLAFCSSDKIRFKKIVVIFTDAVFVAKYPRKVPPFFGEIWITPFVLPFAEIYIFPPLSTTSFCG